MKLSKSKAKYIAKAEKVLGKYNIATPLKKPAYLKRGSNFTEYGI